MKTDRVSYYFLKEKWNLLIVALTGIIYNVGLTFTPWFEGKMVQYLCDILGGTKEVSSMILLCICYVITVFVVQLMRYFKRLYVRKFANSINKNMRMTVFNNLLNSGLKDSENTGTVMTKVISDVESCAEGMRKFTTELFDTGVVMISYMVMLLIYDCKLTLVCMIFPLIAYILAEKLKTVVERNVRKYKESTALLNSASFERIDNALTYRVYGQESNRNALFENNLLDYENKAVRANIYENSMQPLYQLICMTGAVLVIIYGVLNIQKSIWDIAAFTTYFSCYQKLALKSSKAAKLFNAVQKAEVSWKRIKPYLRYCDYDKDEEMDFGKELSVNNVSFGYHDGDILLNNISFKAKPGEIIGITGRVASGKTTFGKLFIGELSYTGDIFLGNKLLR
ncbi:MAG: ABC transporter transmembrane domain-containing protein, partial [Erysipelotrichaceae bacterium]